MDGTGVASIALSDGRRLAYAVAGDPSGAPVLLAHGFPGSRLEAEVLGDAASAAGVRLVCPDRPGFGASDRQPERRFEGWGRDALELANALGIDRFAVLGFSAGVPFALAAAATLGERVVACATVSSPGPLDRPGATSGMSLVNRAIFGAGRRVPMLASLIVQMIGSSARAEPAVVARRMARGMADADRRILLDPVVGTRYGAALREAFRAGTSGAVAEARLLVRPWTFGLDAIAAPGTIWHGLDDRNVPVTAGRALAAGIPGA